MEILPVNDPNVLLIILQLVFICRNSKRNISEEKTEDCNVEHSHRILYTHQLSPLRKRKMRRQQELLNEVRVLLSLSEETNTPNDKLTTIYYL
jgi:hypothetical protein